MKGTGRHLKYVAMIIVGIVVAGTAGFMAIMHWGLLDSLYMTVITLTTVGFSEVHPLTPAGRVFTMLLIMGGVLTIGYSVRVLAEYVVEQDIFANFGRRRMEKKLAQMKGHIIVCGHGRIGQQVVEALKGSGRDYVIVDRNLKDYHFSEDTACVDGDATDEEMLKRAGIERAGVLIAVVGSDADNLFITMTARGLNHGLRIISRATEAGVRNKLLRAGADSVVLPYEIGGRRIASMVLTPSVCEFLDTLVYAGGEELRMEEVEVLGHAWLQGKDFLTADIRRRTGAVVLAVKKADGVMLSNPPSEMPVRTGDRLISLGTSEQLSKLKKLATTEKEIG